MFPDPVDGGGVGFDVGFGAGVAGRVGVGAAVRVGVGAGVAGRVGVGAAVRVGVGVDVCVGVGVRVGAGEDSGRVVGTNAATTGRLRDSSTSC